MGGAMNNDICPAKYYKVGEGEGYELKMDEVISVGMRNDNLRFLLAQWRWVWKIFQLYRE